MRIDEVGWPRAAVTQKAQESGGSIKNVAFSRRRCLN
jgi:hypothetical protein